MKKLILALSFFTLGFLGNNYFFKKAWNVDRLTHASAMQAKMSYIKGCVESNKINNPEKTSYGECELRSEQTYKDIFEIMTTSPGTLFTTKDDK